MIPQNSSFVQQVLWNDKILHRRSDIENENDDIINRDNILKYKIETILGHSINNIHVFKEALIHKSAQKIYNCSNERLEFLGDAILNTSVAHFVFMTYQKSDEGFLTKMRTKLVNKNTLAYLAKQTHLHELIITSKQITQKKINDKILEDAFEAFIGALYLNVGFIRTQKYVIDLMKNHIEFNEILVDNNYKDILLRHSQKEFSTLPEYILESSEGPPHNRIFNVYVTINEKRYGMGNGNTKKNAEQMAAKLTLEELGINLNDNISSKT